MQNVNRRKKERERLADHLGAGIAIDALRTPIPGDDLLVGIQHK